MNNDISTLGPAVVNDHLTNWTAAGWLGGIALLLMAGLLGAAAVFFARVGYWRTAEGPDIGWWWFAGAFASWATSTWILIDALAALARHSPTLNFVGWFTVLGVALIIAAFIVAASRADTLCDEIKGWKGEPRWFPLVWVLPALVVLLVGVLTHFEETSLRDQWGEAVLAAIPVAAFFALLMVGLVKVAKFVYK